MSTIEFNQALLSNSEYLKPFAVTLTRDNEAAKDLMQETMFRALANREKYNFGTNIKAWLYTIMRNIFINNYRSSSKRQLVANLNDEPNFENNKFIVPADALARMGQKEIEMALHNLPELFRHPFVLYFEGYKYNEIAYALQEPLGTIKSRIHFARKLLKQHISRF